MTSRPTFAEIAATARLRLDTHAQRAAPATGRRPAAEIAAEAGEYVGALRRVLKVMGGYASDLAAASGNAGTRRPGQADPWQQAAVTARDAIRDAVLHLPPRTPAAQTPRPRQNTASTTRDLETAAKAMTAARDLLHTHLATSPDGTLQHRSEWASVITSPPVSRALLTELAGWSRPIIAHGAYLTSPSAHSAQPLTGPQRRLLGICQNLSALVKAVDTAHTHHPVAAADIDQLSAIPANSPPERRLPGPAETITGLCQGAIDTAERARRAAAAVTSAASWSPNLTVESFRQTAAYATVISHHCQIIQESLAARARQLDARRLAASLHSSAVASARARQEWANAGRAWYHLTTDAVSDVTAVSEETADLALWTGRLAYTDRNWTLRSGPARDHRPPSQLAPSADDLTRTAIAVHQATATLTALAASDYTQIRIAARSGRILVPVVRPSGPDQPPRRYDRAPAERVDTLLGAYRDAGAASVKATAKISEITASAPIRDFKYVAAWQNHEKPGPVERTLIELGITSPDLLHQGSALDHATRQLITQAARQTAPQRWDTAVKTLRTSADTAQIVNHVLAQDGPWTARSPARRPPRASSRRTSAEPDQPQAER